MLNVQNGVPEWLALVIAVLAGTTAGAVQGYSFARTRVPAFVVTLAGLLTWNGLMLYILGTSGTINLDDQASIKTAEVHDEVFSHKMLASEFQSRQPPATQPLPQHRLRLRLISPQLTRLVFQEDPPIM